ncbi:MAG: amino acid permease [Candidatus Latescibacteria bacterium]|nr:amino acid permease [Candidatus Latescibacterota bacterium]
MTSDEKNVAPAFDPFSTETELKRELGPVTATNVIVGTVIGAGIFVGPSIVAKYAGSSGLTLLVWVVCGFLCFCGTLCYAELGSMMPRAGGHFVYLREAFSPVWSFLYGWTFLLVLRPGGIAAVSTAFATYFGYFISQVVPYPEWVRRLVALLPIVSLSYINYRGISLGGFVQNVFTFLKVAAMCALVAFGLGTVHGSLDHFRPVWPASFDTSLIGMFSLGMIASLGAYGGWESSTYVAEEIKNPRKFIPLSLLLGLSIATLIYLLVNTAYLSVLSNDGMARSDRVATDMMERIIGPVGGSLISLAVLISTFGTLNAQILTGPRVCYAMAKQRMFFQWVARVHPTYRTPSVATVIVAVAAALQLLFLGYWERIVASQTAAGYFFFLLNGVGLFILRRKRPDVSRPYRTWGYPVTPVLFILICFVFLVSIVLNDPGNTLIGLLITALGVPVYWRWVRRAP